MNASRHTITDSDVINMPDDVLTYSEALAIARHKADEGMAINPGTMVIGIGVSLEGYKWTWWYKLGWRKSSPVGSDRW